MLRYGLNGWLLVACAAVRLTAQCPDGSVPPCGRAAPAIHADRIAVLPFRTQGADQSLAFLRHGAAELLAVEFNGDASPTSVDPLDVGRALRRAGVSGDASNSEAVAVAARLGAGQVVVGSIVGSRQRISITASIRQVPGARLRAGPVSVATTIDSIGAGVRQLAGMLLVASDAASRDHHTDGSATTPEVLRAYLEARDFYRKGDHTSAEREFVRALDLDSTFVPAAYWISVMTALEIPSAAAARAAQLAWTQRQRLSASQRSLLEAIYGNEGPGSSASRAHVHDAVARFTIAQPYSAEAWYIYADGLLHGGALMGRTSWERDALWGFRAAMRSDTTPEILDHIAVLAVRSGDSLELRRVVGLLNARAPRQPSGDIYRYAALLGSGETSRLRAARLAVVRNDLGYGGYPWAAGLRLPLSELDSILAGLARNASTPGHLVRVAVLERGIALNAGQPSRAARARARAFDNEVDHDLDVLAWADGDSVATERLWQRTRAPGVPWRVPCEVSLSLLRRGDTSRARRALELLAGSQGAGPRMCDRLGRAILASTDSDVSPLLAVDSLLASAPLGMSPQWNHDLAMAFARHGRWSDAHRAVQRRLFAQPARLALSLRDEALWAARAGRVVESQRALKEWLRWRMQAEPEVRADDERVRAEIVRH